MTAGELKARLAEVDDAVPVTGHLHMSRDAAGNLALHLVSEGHGAADAATPVPPPVNPVDPDPDAEIAAAEADATPGTQAQEAEEAAAAEAGIEPDRGHPRDHPRDEPDPNNPDYF